MHEIFATGPKAIIHQITLEKNYDYAVRFLMKCYCFMITILFCDFIELDSTVSSDYKNIYFLKSDIIGIFSAMNRFKNLDKKASTKETSTDVKTHHQNTIT